MQKAGPERYVLLPRVGEDYLPAGDYYLAAISEGVNPDYSSGVIGTGTSSGVLTSVGPLAITHLGTATPVGTVQPVTLAGGQIKAYQFTVPANTSSLEVRLDNRVGNPWMSLVGSPRLPAPPYYFTYIPYGYGTYYGFGGGDGGIVDDNILTIPNPAPGVYSALTRASGNPNIYPYDYPDATANLVVTALTPVPVSFNGGTSALTNQPAGSWRYFVVNVPTGVLGWDVRVRNVTGPVLAMVVRRDQLPDGIGTTPYWGCGYSSCPQVTTTWPSGNEWSGTIDWTTYYYNSGPPANDRVPPRLVAGMGHPLEPGIYYVGVFNSSTDTAVSYTIDSRGIGTGANLSHY